MYRFLLSPRWLLAHVAVAIAAATCVALGLWQLRRLDERRAHNLAIERMIHLPPVPLDQVAAQGASAAYRRVEMTGSYDPGREVVLRFRSLNEQPGNHLLTPLVGDGGRAIVVDRGWVPLLGAEGTSAPSGAVRVTGILVPAEERGAFGPRIPAKGTLTEVPRIDVPRIGRQLPYPVHPLYLMLRSQDPPQPGPLPVPVDLPPLTDGPHLSYAVQWFSFATIALVTYGVVVRKEGRRPLRPSAPKPARLPGDG